VLAARRHLERRAMMVDKSDRFHPDPDKVRRAELCREPPGRERVRVTVEYVSGEVSRRKGGSVHERDARTERRAVGPTVKPRLATREAQSHTGRPWRRRVLGG
jgi:hypothetical protein